MKRRTALLLTAAVLCSVTALAPTASAAPSVTPNTGVGADVYTAPTAGPDAMDACPGTSAAAAGFTDTTSTDVDCLAMFGITTGATATTYEPAGTIPRWQMALFIHRMFVPTGVAAAGTTTVPAFTDISGLSTEIQNAVNALASHSITLGTTSTTFSPDDLVTREQMALFLNRFASIATDHAGAAITAVAAATGNYNYTDITTATWEGMESIIRLYNLGVTDGACTAGTQYVTAGTCLTTYRPAENITRAEMAGMVHRLLNLTNARPAGLSVQSTTSTALVGTESPLISMRNADFSAQVNTLVDEFYQVHDDTAGVAAQAPFNSLSGVCSGNVAKTAGGTLCYVDATDASTDVRGNITGTSQTTVANSTSNWWVHTGATGTQYVDGTTSGHYLYSINFGAAAAATVYANKTTYTSDAGYATVTNLSGTTGVTANDGITTYAGESRTFTATQVLTTALTSTVVDGYTFKVATHKVDHLGNQTNSTAYYPTSAGVASWTVTCGADDSTLNGNYFESYELTVTMAAADGGTGIPVGGGDPLDTTVFGTGVGGNSATLNVSCDDAARAYTGGTTNETLAISSNNYTQSVAGSLGSVTATAYDQYGAGKSGVSVTIQSATDGAAAATQAVLTTGTNGTASLSAVICPTTDFTVAWSISDPGGNPQQMDLIAASAPGAASSQGTTMYCSTAQADGAFGDVAAVAEVQTVGLTAGAADLGGQFTLAYGGVSTAALAFNADAAAMNAALNGTSTLEAGAAVSAEPTLAADASSWVITFNTNWGDASLLTCDADGGTGLTGTTPACAAVTQGAQGVAGITEDFLEEDTTANTVVTKRTTTGAVNGASAAVVTYHTFTYDSTDAFNIGAAAAGTAVNGGSEAEFETALTAETGTNIEWKGSYRTGALTTGISAFQLG